MKRRDFLAAASVAGAAPLGVISAASAAQHESGRDYIEVRKVLMESAEKRDAVDGFMRDALIPAANRAGISKVGVFHTTPFEGGEEDLAVHLVLVHSSLGAFESSWATLEADEEFHEVGSEILDRPKDNPSFLRMENSLLLAFSHFPRAETHMVGEERFMEMRIYESHSGKFAGLKREMFNEGGEIEVFNKCGFHPNFWGQALTGSLMPNLTYMLTFKDADDHKACWGAFRDSPDWAALKTDPKYKGTVSHITKIFLKPREYSQI